MSKSSLLTNERVIFFTPNFYWSNVWIQMMTNQTILSTMSSTLSLKYLLITCSPIVTTTSLYMTNIPRYVTNVPPYRTNILPYVTNTSPCVTNISSYMTNLPPYVTNIPPYMTNIPRYVTKHLTLYDKRLTLCDKRRTVSWGQSKCMSTLHYTSTDTRDSWSLETSGHNILARCHGPLPSEGVRKRRPWKRMNLRLLFSCFQSIFCFECQIIDLLVQRAKQLQGLGMISDQTTLLLHPWYHQYIWTPDNTDKRKRSIWNIFTPYISCVVRDGASTWGCVKDTASAKARGASSWHLKSQIIKGFILPSQCWSFSRGFYHSSSAHALCGGQACSLGGLRWSISSEQRYVFSSCDRSLSFWAWRGLTTTRPGQTKRFQLTTWRSFFCHLISFICRSAHGGGAGVVGEVDNVEHPGSIIFLEQLGNRQRRRGLKKHFSCINICFTRELSLSDWCHLLQRGANSAGGEGRTWSWS